MPKQPVGEPAMEAAQRPVAEIAAEIAELTSRLNSLTEELRAATGGGEMSADEMDIAAVLGERETGSD